MYKSVTTVFFLFIITTFCGAQKTEVRDLERFSEIAFATGGTIYLKQGSTQKVELKGDPDDLEEIRTEVRSGRLIIKNRSTRWLDWGSNKNVEYYITVEKLEGIDVSGAGKLIGESTFTTDFLELHISGAGKMDLEAKAQKIDLSISGSGKIVLAGEGKESEISISGSGKVDAEDFIAQEHEVRISGSGSCYIHAEESIDARISGSGSVHYKGNARNIDSSSSGSGKVKRM